MSKKNDSRAQQVDLGLEELLSRTKAPQEKNSAQGARAPEPTSIVTINEDVGGLSTEFSDLARARQWGIIVGRAETAFSSEDDVEARLWWIRAHLGAFSLPVSLLAAPFETVCRQLHGHPKEVQLFGSLISEIGDIMQERLRGVGDRRQEHMVTLALHQLGLLEPDETTRAEWGKTPSAAPRFELGTPKSDSVEGQELENVKAPKRITPIVLLGLLALLVFAAIAIYTGWYRAQPEVVVASEGMLEQELVPALAMPVVEARDMRGNLEAIYYSIADRGVVPPPQVDRPAAPAAQGGVAPGLAKSPSKEVPAIEKPLPAAKEVISTDGPIEGTEFRRGVDNRGGLEARLPQPGLDLAPKPIPSATMPEVGGAVLGDVKSVIVPTNVLDSPSYEARILGRLFPGDKVSVETRNGRWLRIRSRRGKTGYVFAQDIGEEEDFRLPDANDR